MTDEERRLGWRQNYYANRDKKLAYQAEYRRILQQQAQAAREASAKERRRYPQDPPARFGEAVEYSSELEMRYG